MSVLFPERNPIAAPLACCHVALPVASATIASNKRAAFGGVVQKGMSHPQPPTFQIFQSQPCHIPTNLLIVIHNLVSHHIALRIKTATKIPQPPLSMPKSNKVLTKWSHEVFVLVPHQKPS